MDFLQFVVEHRGLDTIMRNFLSPLDYCMLRSICKAFNAIPKKAFVRVHPGLCKRSKCCTRVHSMVYAVDMGYFELAVDIFEQLVKPNQEKFSHHLWLLFIGGEYGIARNLFKRVSLEREQLAQRKLLTYLCEAHRSEWIFIDDFRKTCCKLGLLENNFPIVKMILDMPPAKMLLEVMGSCHIDIYDCAGKNIDVAIHLYGEGYPIYQIIEQSARADNVEVAKHFVCMEEESYQELADSLIQLALNYHAEKILVWLIDRGHSLPKNASEIATSYNPPSNSFLEFLLKNNVVFTETTMRNAIREDYTETIQWLKEHNCPTPSDVKLQ